MVTLCPTRRYKLQFQRMVRKNRRMTREQKVAEELQWRRVVDQVQMESEGVEPLLDSFYG